MNLQRPWLDNYPAGVAHEVDLDEFKSIVPVLATSCTPLSDRTA